MEDNVAVARRFVEEAFAKNNPALLDELLSEDFIEHHRAITGNKAGVVMAMQVIHTASPDVEYTFINSISQVDFVCLQYRSAGTQTGPIGSFPPSGKRYDIDVVDVFRIKDSKISEHWSLPDRMAMMEDLGFWPPKQASVQA